MMNIAFSVGARLLYTSATVAKPSWSSGTSAGATAADDVMFVADDAGRAVVDDKGDSVEDDEPACGLAEEEVSSK